MSAIFSHPAAIFGPASLGTLRAFLFFQSKCLHDRIWAVLSRARHQTVEQRHQGLNLGYGRMDLCKKVSFPNKLFVPRSCCSFPHSSRPALVSPSEFIQQSFSSHEPGRLVRRPSWVLDELVSWQDPRCHDNFVSKKWRPSHCVHRHLYRCRWKELLEDRVFHASSHFIFFNATRWDIPPIASYTPK